MFRSFIVGMVAMALALAPVTPAFSQASSPATVENLDHWAEQLDSDQAEDLALLAEAVYHEHLTSLEDAMAGVGPQGNTFRALGDELDDLSGSLSGRPRQHGELYLTLNKQLADHPIQTKLVDGKPVILDKVATYAAYDLTVPAQAQAFDPVAGEALAHLFDRAEWSVLSMSGNAQTKVFHTLVLRPRKDSGMGSDASLVVPFASFDPNDVSPDGSGYDPMSSYSAGRYVLLSLVTGIILGATF